MATENTPDLRVDTSTPAPLERRNSLEKHLQNRPDAQDLKNRHILLDTNAAPSLQAAAVELERQRNTDNLRKGLEHRPDRQELVDRNILASSTVAPGIQGQQKDLDKSLRKDSLEQKLQNRPSPEGLIEKGILEENENPVQS